MKAKKANNNKLNHRKKVIVIIALAVIVLAALLIVALKLTEKKPAATGLDRDDFYSEDQCRCLERERFYCLSGYELQGEICINKTQGVYTGVVRGCSKYECSGITYTFDKSTGKWEQK